MSYPQGIFYTPLSGGEGVGGEAVLSGHLHIPHLCPMPATAHLIRTYHSTHTQGMLSALDEYGNILFHCVTLELPWRDNQKGTSCIPEGAYQVQHRTSPKHGDHYQVLDVPGRELILFHPGNYVWQLLGCILPGSAYKQLDADGIPDIMNTRATLNAMLAAIGPRFQLNIMSAPVPGGTLPEAVVTAPAAP